MSPFPASPFSAVKLAFTGLVLLGWMTFGLSTIRMDSVLSQGGSLYVPSGSLGFESALFVLLIIGSFGLLVMETGR